VHAPLQVHDPPNPKNQAELNVGKLIPLHHQKMKTKTKTKGKNNQYKLFLSVAQLN
jgi:hypothetical protein